MPTLNVFACQEDILLNERLVADPNISEGQRGLISKLLGLFGPEGPRGVGSGNA